MKSDTFLKVLKYLSCIIFFLYANSVMAGNRTVTVEWAMPSNIVDEITEYRLNYSLNSDMSDATVAECDPWQQTGTTGDQTNFSMTCRNVPIVTGQIAYFTLDAIKTDNSVLTSSVFSKDTRIIKVADFKVLTPGANLPPTAVISSSTTSGNAPLTVNFDAGGSTDSDGTVVAYSWDFGDGSAADTSAAPSHTFSEKGTYEVTLKVTDDDGAVSQPATTTINVLDASAAPTYAINFQPADVPVPEGFQADSGQAFDATRGYGWVSGPASLGTRDRDNADSPDQAYDTMIHVSPSSVWEVVVPNGTYTVTVCAGDPTWPRGTQDIQIEGKSVIENEVLSNAIKWIEKTTIVNVTDGKITMTFTGSSDPARLSWIKVFTN